MSCCGIDQECGLLPDFPYSIVYNTPRCSLATPNWKFDPFRQDFCNKWGHFAPELCCKPCNTRMDIHRPMCVLDKFSKPPLFRTSKCKTKFRYQRKTWQDDPIPCGRPCLRSAYNCDNPSSMINRTFFGDDVLCGNCPSGRVAQPFKDECDPCSMEFPFIIQQCPDTKIEPVLIRSGAERCLHPSKIRYLTTTAQAAVPDFYNTKSQKDLELYRSKYAIDNRRPPPKLPCGEQDRAICDWPVTVKPKCAQWKGKDLRPTYDIIIPNPLTVEPLDFCMTELKDFPTECRVLPCIIND